MTTSGLKMKASYKHMYGNTYLARTPNGFDEILDVMGWDSSKHPLRYEIPQSYPCIIHTWWDFTGLYELRASVIELKEFKSMIEGE